MEPPAKLHLGVDTQQSRHRQRITIQRSDGRTEVQIDGQKVRYLTSVSVDIRAGDVPRVSMSVHAADLEFVLNDAELKVSGVGLPESVARSLYEQLKAEYEAGDVRGE